jgi:hypothetical protein
MRTSGQRKPVFVRWPGVAIFSWDHVASLVILLAHFWQTRGEAPNGTCVRAFAVIDMWRFRVT